jgi:phosphopantetheinyl transferase (holo-ACP synthase)
LIGNDIIDLSLAKIESNWQRRGFLEKQFTTNEQQLILAATNSFSLVWRFWSMKEAAYKVFTQQNEMCFFAPKKFDCLLISNKEGMVLYKDEIFYSSSIVTQDYIFTLASYEKSIKPYSKFTMPQDIDIMIKIKLEDITTFSAIEIEQKKSKNGAPFYYYKDILLTRSCSISHHGNYGVFSLLYA